MRPGSELATPGESQDPLCKLCGSETEDAPHIQVHAR